MPYRNDASDAGAPLLRMIDTDKSFGNHRVLSDVSLDFHAGEVHVLAGENGAGKSTLINVLGGVHRPDAGRIEMDDREVRFHHPREAAGRGIAIIHQELSLVPSMSIVDNLFLGREQSRFGWLRRAAATSRAREALAQLGLHVNVYRPVRELPISAQQIVEIAKALLLNARVIVMDEPTSALNEPEAARLFTLVHDLRRRGCAIIYITHRLDEIAALADRISVLRDGRKITTRPASELPAEELVRCMIGRTLSEFVPSHERAPGGVRLRVEHCTVLASRRGAPPVVNDVSFDVRAGEVLGIVGLQGAGVSDLFWAVFGALGKRASASIEIDGRRVTIRSPQQAKHHGLALVTNDRKQSGLVLGMSVMENATLAMLPRLTPGGWMRGGPERRRAMELATSLRVRAASITQRVETLSGGNQQKVVLAKWVGMEPRIFLLDDPTRGVDVGAKREIYMRMNEWVSRGCSIVFSSSELPELLEMSDRILVMRRGHIVAEFNAKNATQEKLLHAAMGESARG